MQIMKTDATCKAVIRQNIFSCYSGEDWVDINRSNKEGKMYKSRKSRGQEMMIESQWWQRDTSEVLTDQVMKTYGLY